MNLSKRIGAGLVAVALAASALAGATPAAAANKTDLVIGTVTDIKSWDPTQGDIGHLLPYYQSVYDNLILRTPDGKYKPNLATRWVWNKSGTVLTMSLREGVKFSDGSAFNATVAKANLDAFIAGNGPQRSTINDAKIAVIDPRTISITLTKANPDLEYFLSTSSSFMASPKAIGTAGVKTKPVGSGPYLFSEASVTGSQIVVTANPTYWDKSKVKFKKITFKILSDTTARLNAIISGQVDATILDVKTASTAKGRGLTQMSNYVDWQGLLLFDREGTKNKALANVKVRQAIAYAIDRPALLKAVQGGYGQVTNQAFSPNTPAYDKALDSTYPLNIAKAKALLTEAGFGDGVTLNMPTWVDPTMNAVLKDQLAKAGITINWVSTPPAEYRNQAITGKFEAAIYQLNQPNIWAAINQMAGPDATWNVLKAKSTVVDAAMKSIETTPTAANIAKQGKVVNSFLTKDAWVVPFYRLPQLFFTNKRIKTINQATNAVPYIFNYSPTGK
jgi:peptide/nickel transport system substrate-binding protein